MKLVESILYSNPCYSGGRKLDNGVQGLMLHSVGCPQPNASVFINNWNKASYTNACVHGFIDGNDGTVYQTLPWDWRGWHCGSGSKGSGNNTHIGVEMCEPACISYTSGSSFTCSDTTTAKAVAKRTYEAAVELFAMLCEQYNLNPLGDGVIISHKEGYTRGIASNHGDPEHLWTQLGMEYTMDTFRAAVNATMGNGSIDSDTSSGGEIAVSSLPAVPFTVKVIISNLNYRSEGSMNGKVLGQTGKGTFTIVEVNSAGWGKLKSGAGWIYLLNPSYCTIGSTEEQASESGSSSEVPFMVRVEISNLNIRTGPGTNYSKTGNYTGKGTFTIVQVSSGTGSNSGWGKLKSGAGWISLDFATRI